MILFITKKKKKVSLAEKVFLLLHLENTIRDLKNKELAGEYRVSSQQTAAQLK